MSPRIVLLQIAVSFITISNSITLVRGSPWLGGSNNFNRPGSLDKFPKNWDDSGSPNGYPWYCKRLHKKIFIDEQIFPFGPCNFEDDNTDYFDDSDDGYSQNSIRQSNRNRDNEKSLGIASFNAPSNQGNQLKISKPKKPQIPSFNAHESSGFHGLEKGVMDNDNSGLDNSIGKTGSTHEYQQRSEFQAPGELLQARNYMKSLTANSNAHLSRDKFSFANEELFEDPSRFMIHNSPIKSSVKQETSRRISGERQGNSRENINDQLDRDKILSILNSKGKYDLDDYRSLEKFFNPSHQASSNTDNDDRYFKFSTKQSSNNRSDEKNNSSTPVNQTTPKSILKKKNFQESKDVPPQYYHYTSSLQNAPNLRFNQVIPPSYHGVKSGSFSINGFGPFNHVQDESALQESKTFFGMNSTSDEY
ncbi:uncharacterized protein LOC120349778 [Nilaparvata lugens]|uniref:uncharacterized protein LOC120349778 n=1 Tax=Nilaparvata lugens TaxID=108931 RepID=UPI00193DDB9E|nr:uncharacterized protein LOC120349778 [Nilaparvata lugens]